MQRVVNVDIAPVEETVVKAPVEETVVEAPVEETVVEAPVEETVVEVDSTVEDAPEEALEPVEEKVVELDTVEDASEEAPVEEKVVKVDAVEDASKAILHILWEYIFKEGHVVVEDKDEDTEKQIKLEYKEEDEGRIYTSY